MDNVSDRVKQNRVENWCLVKTVNLHGIHVAVIGSTEKIIRIHLLHYKVVSKLPIANYQVQELIVNGNCADDVGNVKITLSIVLVFVCKN